MELGFLIMPTATPDGYMRTYWRHRVALAYLAATDKRWKDTMAEKLTEMFANFMRCIVGGAIVDEHRWMSRPRACVYDRQINHFNDTPAQHVDSPSHLLSTSTGEQRRHPQSPSHRGPWPPSSTLAPTARR